MQLCNRFHLGLSKCFVNIRQRSFMISHWACVDHYYLEIERSGNSEYVMSFRCTRILICRGGPHVTRSFCYQYRTSLPVRVVQSQTSCLALTWAILYVPDPAFAWNMLSLTFLVRLNLPVTFIRTDDFIKCS